MRKLGQSEEIISQNDDDDDGRRLYLSNWKIPSRFVFMLLLRKLSVTLRKVRMMTSWIIIFALQILLLQNYSELLEYESKFEDIQIKRRVVLKIHFHGFIILFALNRNIWRFRLKNGCFHRLWYDSYSGLLVNRANSQFLNENWSCEFVTKKEIIQKVIISMSYCHRNHTFRICWLWQVFYM